MGALEGPPQTAGVLQELLLALVGHVGDVFVDTRSSTALAEPDHCTFAVSADLDFFSRADRIVLNELLELGFHCHHLQAFVHDEELSWCAQQGSQYRCALANGIRELLDVYGHALTKAERHLQSERHPSLATLNYFLSDFKVILPAIHRIAHDIAASNLKGSDILQLLHHKLESGVSEIQSCLARLQWHCHQVLFKQLKAWLVHGLLVDPYEEFFIQPSTSGRAAAAASVSGHQSDSTAADWHKGFEVRMGLLPPEISSEVPLSVLFVGKAVRVLQLETSAASQDKLGAAAALERLQAEPAFDSEELKVVVESIRAQAAEQLWRLVVVEGELPLHLAALRGYFLMGRGDFWHNFLQESRSLLSLPVVKATAEANVSLPFQQSAEKSSAEGDPLFSRLRVRFSAEQAPAAAAPSTAFTAVPTLGSQSRILSSAFSGRAGESMGPAALATPAPSGAFAPPGPQTAGLYSQGPSTSKSSPSITPQTGDPKAGKTKRNLKVPDYDPNWDALTLEYKTLWPLHLVLSQEVLMRYSRIFQYLFRLKRLQVELESAWAAAKNDCKRGPEHSAGGGPPLWQVRSHMAHFVNNLQLYIQVDVIEVQYHKLLATMKEVVDLKAAARAHEGFLAACVVQSCLDVPMFSTLLSKILVTCKSFCSQLQSSREGLLSYPVRLVEDFQRSSRLLYKLLSTPSMQSRARAPFLRQLLLRLNFNGYVQQDTERHAAQTQAPPLRSLPA